MAQQRSHPQIAGMIQAASRASILSLALLAACGGSEPTARPVPAKLAITAQPSSVTAGETFQVVVAIQDSSGVTVQDATSNVTIAFTGGGFTTSPGDRTLGGTLTKAAVAGVATFDNLSINRDGGHVLRASTGVLPPVNTGVIATNAAAPAVQAVAAGDNQVAAPNGDVAVKPAVRVTDTFGNGVNGLTVTFAVASGGGSVTGATQVTANGGVATIGSWTLGASGTNSLTATVTGASLAATTFTARVSTVSVSGVTPGLLVPGGSATVTGTGFSAAIGENSVTLDGTAATITAASATSITFTVPSALACEPTHDGIVRVAVGADFGTKAHPIQAARQHTLGVGDALIVPPGESRCNELATGGAEYLVAIYNTNVLPVVASTYALRAAGATGGAAGGPALRAAAQPMLDLRQRGSPMRPVAETGDQLHTRILEENARVAERRGPEFRERVRRGQLRAAPERALAVGDLRSVRIPNVNVQGFCGDYFEVNTKVVYAGTRTVILEDVTNQLAGQIDSTWNQIGQEFDATMYDIVATNFADPLGTDPFTDNDGKIVMVFSRIFNENFPTLGGFVVSCDFFARGSGNTSSNFGEFFYARVPTVPGTLGDNTNNPVRWRWTMRSTIIHEVKHVASMGTRIRAGGLPEASWLEESTARVAEELLERAAYGFVQRSNIGYGSASDPRGPWCDVRACNGHARGIARIFEDLNTNWYRIPESFSAVGRKAPTDFTFYNTGWSLVRWAVDQSSATESAFLRALTTGPESGAANLTARTGRAMWDMIPEWALAMALDDHPVVTPSNNRLQQPSWNLRSVMDGLSRDWPDLYLAWPLITDSRTFGAFTATGQVYAGTAQFFRITGLQTAKQLLELRAADLASNAPAPAELGIAIVRIQ